MTSRNMVEANVAIFLALDQYCLQKKNPITNAGKKRWIASTPTTRAILKEASFESDISFSRGLKVARFDHNLDSYFFVIGLDLPVSNVGNFLDEIDVDGSLLTLALSELQPAPSASDFQVRDIVEYDDKDRNPNYTGHQASGVASLFPRIQCYKSNDLSIDETRRAFFLLCLADSNHGPAWMDVDLKETFASLSELSPTSIPYQTLCRSVFDTDPSSVFLALYRCLEALYAYSHVTQLNGKLGLSKPWDQVAELLERQLGWRPREESSLEILLRSAPLKHDLEEALDAMNIKRQANSDVFSVATKSIYQLRNSLVHYRPLHQQLNPQCIDWNRLCKAMCCLVHDAYESI